MTLTTISTSLAAVLVASGTLATGWGALVALDGDETPTAASPSETPTPRVAQEPADAPAPASDDPFAGPAASADDPSNPLAQESGPPLDSDPPASVDPAGMQGRPGMGSAGMFGMESGMLPEATRGGEEDLATIQARRVPAARHRLDAVRSAFEDGTVNLDRYLDAVRSLRDAQLDAAADRAQLRRIYLQAYHDQIAEIVSRVRAQFEVGVTGEVDLMEAEQALVEAAWMLAKEPSDPGDGLPEGPAHADPTVGGGPTMPDMMGGETSGMPGMSGVGSDYGMVDGGIMPGNAGSEYGMMSAGGGMASRTDGPDDAEPSAGRGDDPASMAITAKLDAPIAIPFAQETPLSDFLEYISSATADDLQERGIPIYVDPAGLEEAGLSTDEPVLMELDGIPLRTTLWLALRQLGLAYSVIDGVLVISTRDLLEEMILQEPIFRGRPDPNPFEMGMGSGGGGFQ